MSKERNVRRIQVSLNLMVHLLTVCPNDNVYCPIRFLHEWLHIGLGISVRMEPQGIGWVKERMMVEFCTKDTNKQNSTPPLMSKESFISSGVGRESIKGMKL